VDEDSFRSLSEKELEKEIKKTLLKKRELSEEAKTFSQLLREAKREFWSTGYTLKKMKIELGRRKAKKCPALGFHEKTGWRRALVCKAKRYKLACYESDLYSLHCFCCKLKPEEAKIAMIYDRVWYGERNEKENK